MRYIHNPWTLTIVLLAIATGVALAVGLPDSPSDAVTASRSDTILLLVYVMMALVVSFLCSIAEAVLLSITPSYIAGLHDKHPKLEQLIRKLKQEKIDQSLAAILTLNTIAHTVGAIGAGSKATIVFGSAWFGVFSAVITLLILFLSEIIPKTLGAVFWRQLARWTAFFVRGLILLLYPLIKASESLTKLIARDKNLDAFSRNEFLALAQIGKRSGEIDEREFNILRNLFRFSSLTANDIMTPRTVIVAVPQSLTVSEAIKLESIAPFSRIPIFDESIDRITGFVLKDDLLLAKAKDQHEQKLESLKREIKAVTAKMPLSGLLEFLLLSREHIALVIDEYGGTTGLVTLEDVVETLLGMEIVDEMDIAADMRVLARRHWEKRASLLGIDIESLHQPERRKP